MGMDELLGAMDVEDRQLNELFIQSGQVLYEHAPVIVRGQIAF